MGCCHSKAVLTANVDVDEVSRKYIRYLKRAGGEKDGLGAQKKSSVRWTKTSHGSSTIQVGAPDNTAQHSCCSNDERVPSDTSETSFSASVAVPTGGEEETDRGRVSLSAYEETGSPKLQRTRCGSIPNEDDLECDDVESTSEDSGECSTTERNQPIRTDLINNDVADRILDAFRKSSVFQGLEDDILLELSAHMKRQVWYDGDVIIRQGDQPCETDCLYFVAKGEVRLGISESSSSTQQTVIKKMGWVFGDLALLFNSPHTASVMASGICILYALSRSDFIDVSKHVSKIRMLRFLRKLPLLKSVSDAKLVEFGNQVQIHTCPKDESLNLDPKMVYIIRKGRIRMEEISKQQRKYVFSRGDLFSVDAESRYKALTDVEWIVVDESIYQQLEGIDHCMLIAEEAVKQIVESLGTLDMELIDIPDIVRRTPVSLVSKNEAILEVGQSIEHLCVIMRGEIGVREPQGTPSHSVLKCHNGRQFFGHKWNRKMISDVDIIATSEEEVQLVKIPHKVLAAAGLRRDLRVPSRSALPPLSCRVVTATPCHYEGPEVSFKDLKQHRVVGEGEYGSVRLVTHKPTGDQYALKIMHKAAIRDIKTAEHVIMERKVLVKLANRNFLVSFQGAYQDQRSIYLLMDWVPGGELFSRIIDSGGRLPETHAVFYAANVVLAYCQMHALNIIYRDLKPENMLIDKNGYLKLADYGFATFADGSAWTVCGTPDYQAPEIISRQGASKASDFWALGVLIFEMLTGDAPFKSPTDDRWDTHRRILSGRFYIPEFVSHHAADLITKLLQVKPEERLGYREDDLSEVKKHPWFKKVDWNRLECQKEAAPFVPKLLHGTDTSFFDLYDSPKKSAIPRSNNFFDRDRPWSNLWSWIDEF